MIIKENKLISDLSVKTFILLALFLFFFFIFGIALSYGEDLPPEEDASGIGSMKDLNIESTTPVQDEKSGKRSIFDLIFNRPAKTVDGEAIAPQFNNENIEVHEPVKSGKFMQSAKFRVIDKTLGKVYFVDKPVGEKYQLNEITVKVKKCWRADEPSVVENSRALFDVYEANKKVMNKVFSGWIFSAAPAISQVAHPKYDVTLEACYSTQYAQKDAPKVEESD